MRVASENSPTGGWQCDYCPREFLFGEELDEHVRIAHGGFDAE